MAFLFFGSYSVQAQINLQRGAVRPTDNQGEAWWLDTVAHRAWHFEKYRWVLLGDWDADTLYECHGSVFAMGKKGGYKFEPGYHTPNWITRCYCGDSMRVVWYGESFIYFHDYKGDLHLEIFSTRWPGAQTLQPQSILGHEAWCVPYLKRGMPPFFASELNTWGMLGDNGQWLIEPKFDEPFEFQIGIAEVLFYGEKRKINEKGEFVDD